jgi:hypothetical protein
VTYPQTDRSTRSPKLYAKGREKSRLSHQIDQDCADYEESFNPGEGPRANGEGNDVVRNHNLIRQDGPGRN